MFYVGDVTAADARHSEVKHLKHIRDVQCLTHGDIVEFLGYVVRYNAAKWVSEPECLQ